MTEAWSDIIVAVIGGVVAIITSILIPVLTTQNKISKQLAQHIKEDADATAESWRVRILRFNDDLCDINRAYPSEANFQQAIADCNKYKTYIDTHTDFHNGIGELAMDNIQSTYVRCKNSALFGHAKV